MQHAVPVGVVEGFRHIRRDLHSFLDRQLTLAVELVLQRLTIDDRHHVVQEAVGFAGVEQRENVRVIEVCGNLDLLQKPSRTECGCEIRKQYLHCYFAVVLQVVGEVHRRHTASADFALN